MDQVSHQGYIMGTVQAKLHAAMSAHEAALRLSLSVPKEEACMPVAVDSPVQPISLCTGSADQFR